MFFGYEKIVIARIVQFSSSYVIALFRVRTNLRFCKHTVTILIDY